MKVRTWDGPAARGLTDVVCCLYRVVFSEEPFNGTPEEFDGQRDYYPKMTARPGFRLATAQVDDEQGEFIGFGYGYLLPSDTTWWDGIDQPVPPEETREDGRRSFALIDFGVLPAWQGKGIGRAIHDELLGGSGAERATLAVQPKATRTEATYLRWGWRRAAHLTNSPGSTFPEFNLLVLDTLPRR
jgi:GNAT superfamily N-acetyltransferase